MYILINSHNAQRAPRRILHHHHSMCHRAVRRCASTLNIVAINARRRLPGHVPQVGAVTAIEIDVFEVESVNVAWEITIRVAFTYLSQRCVKKSEISAEMKEVYNVPLTREL